MTRERLRRALLFAPGDSAEKIRKASALGADSVIIDLEDSVAPDRKTAAREIAAEALRTLDFGRSERLVRTNAVDVSGFAEADIRATFETRPDGYVIPKVERVAQVEFLCGLLAELETAHNRPLNSTVLILLIETGLGVAYAREIAEYGAGQPRVVALAFGAEDYAGSIGAVRTHESREVFVARSLVAMHAKIHGLQAIDSPMIRLDDASLDDLRAETRQSFELGYTGKLAIHPKQLAHINGIFTPTQEEIQSAQRLVDAYTNHLQNSAGVFAFEGRMIDRPLVVFAEMVLRRARAAGLLD